MTKFSTSHAKNNVVPKLLVKKKWPGYEANARTRHQPKFLDLHECQSLVIVGAGLHIGVLHGLWQTVFITSV